MLAKYVRIKGFIKDQIDAGTWLPADRIPSENKLAARFSVSRMTARRAMDELCTEGCLVRKQGLGTFIADIKPASSMLEIHNIADEVTGRGHEYSCRVILVNQEKSSKQNAILLSVEPRAKIFHSTLVHMENELPIQYEDRYVNPRFAPDYLAQDFENQTPNAYLSRVAPLTEVDHVVEAVIPNKAIAQVLKMEVNQPCLKITRRTWSKDGVVSYAYLLHPGHRYRLGGHLNF